MMPLVFTFSLALTFAIAVLVSLAVTVAVALSCFVAIPISVPFFVSIAVSIMVSRGSSVSVIQGADLSSAEGPAGHRQYQDPRKRSHSLHDGISLPFEFVRAIVGLDSGREAVEQELRSAHVEKIGRASCRERV